MLELHDINLTAEDKYKLKQLCISKGSQLKYKDAIALLAVNRDLN